MQEFEIGIFNASSVGKEIQNALEELTKTGKEYDVELSYNRDEEYSNNCVLVIRGEFQNYSTLLYKFFENKKPLDKFSFENVELHIIKSVGIMLLEERND